MIMTPSEVFLASEFAKKIIKNISNRDFYTSQNARRSDEKVFEDNLKCKLTEMNVCNHLGINGIHSRMDFEIYDIGVGDDFDIIANGKYIDVKASSPRAKCIMVEVNKAKKWRDSGKAPDYFSMVSVTENNGVYGTSYMFGASKVVFSKNAKRYKRGDKIPNTNCTLKADNYILTSDHCEDLKGLIDFIK